MTKSQQGAGNGVLDSPLALDAHQVQARRPVRETLIAFGILSLLVIGSALFMPDATARYVVVGLCYVAVLSTAAVGISLVPEPVASSIPLAYAILSLVVALGGGGLVALLHPATFDLAMAWLKPFFFMLVLMIAALLGLSVYGWTAYYRKPHNTG